MPRLLNRLYSLMVPMLEENLIIKQILLSWRDNPNQKIFEDDENFVHELYDDQLFVKFRNLLGGKLKTILTGGAPSTPDVIYFFRVALSAGIYDMYGQTEGI